MIKCDNQSAIALIANLYTLKYNWTLYAWKKNSGKLKLKYCSSDVGFLTNMHVKLSICMLKYVSFKSITWGGVLRYEAIAFYSLDINNEVRANDQHN